MQFLLNIFHAILTSFLPEKKETTPANPVPEAPTETPAKKEPDMPYSSFVDKHAAEYGIPPELVAAVIKIESSGNTWAARYEPNYYLKYIAGKGRPVPSGVSRDTEEHCQATSFGLMQVMGGTARDEGFTGKFLTELCDPDIGIKYGCKHLSTHAKKFTKAAGHDWGSVLAAYNGGQGAVKGPNSFSEATTAYVSKIKAAMGGKLPPR